jgi:hypothetical protein
MDVCEVLFGRGADSLTKKDKAASIKIMDLAVELGLTGLVDSLLKAGYMKWHVQADRFISLLASAPLETAIRTKQEPLVRLLAEAIGSYSICMGRIHNELLRGLRSNRYIDDPVHHKLLGCLEALGPTLGRELLSKPVYEPARSLVFTAVSRRAFDFARACVDRGGDASNTLDGKSLLDTVMDVVANNDSSCAPRTYHPEMVAVAMELMKRNKSPAATRKLRQALWSALIKCTEHDRSDVLPVVMEVADAIFEPDYLHIITHYSESSMRCTELLVQKPIPTNVCWPRGEEPFVEALEALRRRPVGIWKERVAATIATFEGRIREYRRWT